MLKMLDDELEHYILGNKKETFESKCRKIRCQIEDLSMELMKLYEECPHNIINSSYNYYEGSYLDKAYTEYVTQCVCCGKTLEKRREDHSWYG